MIYILIFIYIYFIFILVMPTLFHNKVHDIYTTDDCSNPSLHTFVVDVLCSIIKSQNISLQQTVDNTMNTIEEYMKANRLALNRDKTQMIIINPPIKSDITLEAEPEDVTPCTSTIFLGVVLSDNLNWR